MRRITIVIIGLAVVAAACGDTDTAPTTTIRPQEDAGVAGTSSTLGTSTTLAEGEDDTTTTTTDSPSAVPARQRPEGPDAPDFTLPLGQGGSFTLSEEQKPVFMVFWAEW